MALHFSSCLNFHTLLTGNIFYKNISFLFYKNIKNIEFLNRDNIFVKMLDYELEIASQLRDFLKKNRAGKLERWNIKLLLRLLRFLRFPALFL